MESRGSFRPIQHPGNAWHLSDMGLWRSIDELELIAKLNADTIDRRSLVALSGRREYRDIMLKLGNKLLIRGRCLAFPIRRRVPVPG